MFKRVDFDYTSAMIRRLALPAAALTLAASIALAQAPSPPAPPARQDYVWPERITNAKVLPAAIGSQRLRETMTGYARALGVRCTFCHVGEEGAPLASLDFVSDANPHKKIARGMIRMTTRINGKLLPAIPGLGEPKVTCYTCHRGSKEPETALPPPPPRPQTP